MPSACMKNNNFLVHNNYCSNSTVSIFNEQERFQDVYMCMIGMNENTPPVTTNMLW